MEGFQAPGAKDVSKDTSQVASQYQHLSAKSDGILFVNGILDVLKKTQDKFSHSQ